MSMNIQKAYRTPNRQDQKRRSSQHIIIRTTNALNKDRILKAIREQGQVTYKGKPIRIIPDFSPETMKTRRAWTDVIQTLREHKFQPRLPYPAKLSITIDGETKVFHDKTKYTQYLSTNPALQRIIKGKHWHKHRNYTLEKARKQSFNKPKRRQPQVQNPNSNNKNNWKQQLLFLNINSLNTPIKRHRLINWLHKQDPTFCCLQETNLREKDRHYLRVKGWKTIFQANGLRKQAGVAILISNKIDFQPKVIKKRQGGALHTHQR